MKPLSIFILLALMLSGCNPPPVPPSPTPVAAPNTPAPTTVTPAPTALPTGVPSATPRLSTPAPSPTLAFPLRGPGPLTCPILLYHRIAEPATRSEYYVTPAEFRDQMQALKDWGYTSILPTQLIEAIRRGAPLPERPVIISFDDGDETVYTSAYPIMREHGFIGVNYLVANYLNTPGYMTTRQVLELSAAGWQVGSHSMSHQNLTETADPEWQVAQSRRSLEALLGLPVETFAYPFGAYDANALKLVDSNYSAGMGLGAALIQDRSNLLYLWRRPVKLGWNLATFGSFLPWQTAP